MSSCSAGATSRSRGPTSIPTGSGCGSPSCRRSSDRATTLDAFLDVSLAEDLTAVFTLAGSGSGSANPATAAIVAHPLTLPGSSDAGAHLSSYCGVDYTTRLLTEYVPDALPLESAIARLSAIPAQLVRLARPRCRPPGRGRRPRRVGPGASRRRPDPLGRRTSPRAAGGSSSTPRATSPSSSTAWSSAAMVPTPAHAPAASCVPVRERSDHRLCISRIQMVKFYSMPEWSFLTNQCACPGVHRPRSWYPAPRCRGNAGHHGTQRVPNRHRPRNRRLHRQGAGRAPEPLPDPGSPSAPRSAERRAHGR